MKPPKINTLETDVEFYLHITSYPRLQGGDLRDELLQELHETYGLEAVASEILNQKSK